MPPTKPPVDLIVLPDSAAAYGGSDRTDRRGRKIAPSDAVGKEVQRWLEITRMLGTRLRRWFSASLAGDGVRECPVCGRPGSARMPDEGELKCFAEYHKSMAALAKEQRERVEIIYKYNLQPQMGEDELNAKLAEIVREAIASMPEDELAELLAMRKAAPP